MNYEAFVVTADHKNILLRMIDKLDGNKIDILVPIDKDYWDNDRPVGLNFVTLEHYE